jgi:hypothetical protein
MRILVACEYSARVRDAFRARGHDAWSVDLLPTVGDPLYHFEDDALVMLNSGYPWDMLIAFPPCTDLAASGAQHWPAKLADGRQHAAARFFMQFVNAEHIPRRCIENPRGIMSRWYRKPDQYVHPFHFGEPAWKQTGLWLHGLPKLVHTDAVEPTRHVVDSRNSGRYARGHRDPHERSKISLAIAGAMANQWG